MFMGLWADGRVSPVGQHEPLTLTSTRALYHTDTGPPPNMPTGRDGNHRETHYFSNTHTHTHTDITTTHPSDVSVRRSEPYYLCVCVCVLTSCRFLCAVLPLIFSIQNSALPEGQRGRPWGAAARSCVCQHHAQCVSEFVTGMEPCSWPYSGENKYLTPCGFRKFGHQRNV